MTSQLSQAKPTPSATLIDNWAKRVIGLWEESRTAGITIGLNELGAACRVRDQLNNQLHQPHPSAVETSNSLERLQSADALFRRFTTESRTATNLSCHGHYPHQSEWWWRRLPARHSPAP